MCSLHLYPICIVYMLTPPQQSVPGLGFMAQGRLNSRVRQPGRKKWDSCSNSICNTSEQQPRL